MSPNAATLRAENNLARLTEEDQKIINWITCSSVDDARHHCRVFDSPDARYQLLCETALDYEKSHRNRVTVIGLIRAALKRVTVLPICPTEISATPVECEVLPPESVGTSSDLLAAGGGASVATLVDRINDHHSRAQNDAAHAKAYGQSAVRSAILAGLQLVELKAATPHGQWEAMFPSGLKRVGKAGPKANANHGSHLDFDSRTALKYIAVATQLVTKKLQPEQSAVLMELARGGEMNADAAALLDEIVPDKSLRQAYLELGIVKPTQKEAAWLSAAADPKDPGTDPAAPTAASKLRSAKDYARIDWFGTPKLGMVEPGSIVGMIQNELHFSTTGKGESTLRLLRADELDGIAEDFRRLAKVAAEYAKGKH